MAINPSRLRAFMQQFKNIPDGQILGSQGGRIVGIDIVPPDGALPQEVLSNRTSNGDLFIDWSSGKHFRVDTKGFNITGIAESGQPASGFIYAGTLEIINTGGGDSTIDLTGLTHGYKNLFTIENGDRHLVTMWSTAS